MKKINFKNTFYELGNSFYHENDPSAASDPKLVLWNESLAKELNIELSEEEVVKIFSGNQKVPSSKPLSSVYSGHQFGHFSPRLGDGRAHLLGELKSEKNNKLHDIQLKGSGRNLFSRSGDGRSAIGPVIREYILSEAMHALGVPTTRALCAVSSGDSVFRETELPGGVFTRVSEGLIRVGHFEYFASVGDVESLKKIFNYSVDRFYPELKDSKTKALNFLKAVGRRQSKLIAQWTSYGFIHGVMNTDNSSVVGVTIDYGPCAFMDEYKEDKVFSSIDKNGRYAYNNQSKIAQWNLARLAESLLSLFKEEEIKKELPAFEEVVTSFAEQLEKCWQKTMIQKLGFDEVDEKKLKLLNTWLELLNKKQMDFTMSFRELSKVLMGERCEYLVMDKELEEFTSQWINEIEKEHLDKELVLKKMDLINPLYIPRNHQVEKAIKLGEEEDYTLFYEMVELLKSPFEKNEKFHKYAQPPEVGERVKATFCGT